MSSDNVTIPTERLVLRALGDVDLPAIYEIFSHAEVARYGSRPAMTAMAEAEEWLEKTRSANRSGDALQLGIERRADRAIVGTCTLWGIHKESRRAEVGYSLGRAHWGQGYMVEAVAALMHFGFETLDLNRLEADTDPRNHASIKVLEKLGFAREGYMRERWIVNGEICDTIFYGLLRREYQSTSKATAAAPTA